MHQTHQTLVGYALNFGGYAPNFGGARTQLRGTPPKLGMGMWRHGDIWGNGGFVGRGPIHGDPCEKFREFDLMAMLGMLGVWCGYMGIWGRYMGTWKVWWGFDGHLEFREFVGSLGMDEDMGK